MGQWLKGQMRAGGHWLWATFWRSVGKAGSELIDLAVQGVKVGVISTFALGTVASAATITAVSVEMAIPDQQFPALGPLIDRLDRIIELIESAQQ